MADSVHIEGLHEFGRAIDKMEGDLPQVIRMALADAADIVIDYARPKVPRRSGRARRSLRVDTRSMVAEVVGGGGGAPYYPWLDRGGAVGRRNSVRRPYSAKGRYIVPGYERNRADIEELMGEALDDLAHRAGLEAS